MHGRTTLYFSIRAGLIPNTLDLASHNLKYEKVVNMQDVTGLDRVDFSDILDLREVKPSIPKARRGKMVNFMDKFGNSGPIDEINTWEVCEEVCQSMVPEKIYLKTRN